MKITLISGVIFGLSAVSTAFPAGNAKTSNVHINDGYKRNNNDIDVADAFKRDESDIDVADAFKRDDSDIDVSDAF